MAAPVYQVNGISRQPTKSSSFKSIKKSNYLKIKSINQRASISHHSNRYILRHYTTSMTRTFQITSKVTMISNKINNEDYKDRACKLLGTTHQLVIKKRGNNMGKMILNPRQLDEEAPHISWT